MIIIKKNIIFISITLVYSVCLKAQIISGKVMANDSISIPYATVSLLQAKDSTYITGAISNEDGTFSFATVPTNKLIRVSDIGYKTLILPAADRMVITLEPRNKT